MPIDTSLLQPRFNVPQVDVAGPMTAIGQGIANIVQQRRINDARSSAMKLMQGGDAQGAFAQLMGVGDIQGATAIAGYQRAGQFAQTDQRDRAKSYIDSVPTELRTFYDTHPDQADPTYNQAKRMLMGGMGGDPQMTMQAPTPSPPSAAPSEPPSSMAPAPGESYDQWKQRQLTEKYGLEAKAREQAKLPSQAQAEQTNQILNTQYDLFRKNAESVQADPNLEYITGRYAMLPESAKTALSLYDPKINDLRANLTSLGAQTRSNIMQMYRDLGGGKTGFGRVLLKEWENFGDVLAPISHPQTLEGMRSSLQKIINFARDSQLRINKAYKAQYGVAPPSEQQIAPGMTTTTPTGLPETAPPSAGDVPIQGAPTSPTAVRQSSPDQLRNFLDTHTTGTLHLSDGTSVKAVKRDDGHWYAIDTGKRLD